MTLTEQSIDPELRMIVQVDPVFLADVGVDDKGAVVIQMRVEDHLGDVVLRERDVGHVGEFTDGDVADIVVLVGVLGVARCRVYFCVLRQFHFLRLVVALVLILGSGVITRPIVQRRLRTIRKRRVT